MTEAELRAWAQANPTEALRWYRQGQTAIRHRARTDYLTWCEEVGAARGWSPAAHHRVIIAHVEAVLQGRIKRLLITAPPGAAKSTYTSELLPAHLLSRFPGFNLIGASNTATLAEDFSTRTLALIEQRPDLAPFRLARRAAELWTTSDRGRYRAIGVGGAIAGNRADGVLIDDPVKSREAADSETQREKLWNWFTADLRTRLKPDGWIIIITTRWHESDLAGRLIERQPGQWRVLNLPAQAIAGVVDPLGRQPGEWLWDDDGYGYAAALRQVKAEYEQAGALRDWEALYQGRPTAGEGALFKVGMLDVLEAEPAHTTALVRGWDLAATRKIGAADPDWTVGVKAMRTAEGRYVVLDVVRVRGGPEEVERTIGNTAKQDGPHCPIFLPQDPGQAGKAQIAYLGKQLAGYRVIASPETGDKATRAAPVAAQVNLGNVALVRGAWNAAFRAELAAFPNGAHDDQVDALARAFSRIALNRPLIVSAEALRDLRHGLRR